MRVGHRKLLAMMSSTSAFLFLTAFAGVLVFKEKLSARQIVGITICFVGTLLFL